MLTWGHRGPCPFPQPIAMERQSPWSSEKREGKERTGGPPKWEETSVPMLHPGVLCRARTLERDLNQIHSPNISHFMMELLEH